MYELKYKITDDDIKSVNMSIAVFYFALYLVVAVVGIAVGVVAVVLSSQAMMYVLGIILIVLGAILGVCAVMIMVAPKNFVKSAIPTGSNDLTVNVDGYGIRIKSDEFKLMIRFGDITKVKNKKKYLLVYVGKDSVFVIKNAIRSGLTIGVLYEFLKTKSDDAIDPAVLHALAQKQAENSGSENTEQSEQTDQPEQTETVENIEKTPDGDGQTESSVSAKDKDGTSQE